MDFVAIDFETANASRNSACAIGAVVVKDSVIVERRYSLINPQVPFSKHCSFIHGIDERVVKKAPTFYDIHQMLFDMLNGQTVAAHNASFDVAVLRSSCESRGLIMPEFNEFCSVEMSRKAWPDLPYHRLNYLCEHFGIALKHHNAVEDATACAMIILQCAKELSCATIEDLEKGLLKKSRINEKVLRRREKDILRKIEFAKQELEQSQAH